MKSHKIKMEIPAHINPRYDLDPDEIATREAMLLTELSTISPYPDIYCVWIQPDSPFADIVRTYEARHWSYISDIMADKDSSSEFLIVVDTRNPDTQGVKRVTRITFANTDSRAAGRSGMAIIDDVINSDQGLTLEKFIRYYEEKGVDISTCFSVETNIRIKQADRYNGLPLAEVGYLAMFKKINQLRQGGLSYIFATINHDSIKSFKLIDLRAEPLVGRCDIRTPDEKGGFDNNFQTVALPTTEHNLGIFEQIVGLSAPDIKLS